MCKKETNCSLMMRAILSMDGGEPWGIATLLLGANHVIAVDIDPQALTATRDNLARNQLSDDRLEAWLPESAPRAQAAKTFLHWTSLLGASSDPQGPDHNGNSSAGLSDVQWNTSM